MADLIVPQLGESISEAVVAKWLKQVGDPVAADEPVVDLETDKITVQLPSPVAGALAEQRFAVGATVKVGDVIGQVDPSKAAAAPPPAPKPPRGDGKPAIAAGPTAAKPGATPESAKSVTPVATASVVAESVRPPPKPAPTPGGNGESLAKDALLKLT